MRGKRLLADLAFVFTTRGIIAVDLNSGDRAYLAR